MTKLLHGSFPDKVFGLMHHTLNNNACLGAVGLGCEHSRTGILQIHARTGPDIVKVYYKTNKGFNNKF
jgi:N-acetylneuraminate synthase